MSHQEPYVCAHPTLPGEECQICAERKMARSTALTPVQEALAILSWVREPDFAPNFTNSKLIVWLNRRPVAEVCRVTDALVRADILVKLLTEARQYVSDAGSDEDGETQRLSNRLLAEIDTALRNAALGPGREP